MNQKGAGHKAPHPFFGTYTKKQRTPDYQIQMSSQLCSIKNITSNGLPSIPLSLILLQNLTTQFFYFHRSFLPATFLY